MLSRCLVSIGRLAGPAFGAAIAGFLGAAAFCIAAVASGMAGESAEASEGRRISSATSHARRPVSGVPTLGVYDPETAFRDASRIGLEHVFVFWQALDREQLRGRARYAENRRRRMMVTVEPYTTAPDWVSGGDVLLARVARGEYDGQIRAVCTEVASISGAPLVRWGHEMDDRSGRYPWAGRDPSDYVRAFRHFVQKCRNLAPDAEFVWSPSGQPDLAAYYPGGSFVDHVGLPIWGYQKADRRWHGHSRTFAEALDPKYSLVEGFDKPVIIAEFGVSGSDRYESSWLASYLDQLRSFPLVTTITFYNAREPYEWPDGLGSPDWRLKPSDIGLD